tara:strand:- start:1214 stop:1396 length:183 start_codon:yes stop_codon:yes gene_type:complete
LKKWANEVLVKNASYHENAPKLAATVTGNTQNIGIVMANITLADENSPSSRLKVGHMLQF